MKYSTHINTILQRLPEEPGVYQYFDASGKVIYVGKAKNLKRRVSSYFRKEQDRYKTTQLVRHIEDIKYVVVNSEQDAFLLENNLIKQYQPRYNILLKDGKSYPSICITKEPYPRIFKTRQIQKKQGEYYGPFGFGGTLDLVLELIHKLYPIRTCSLPIDDDKIAKGRYKVCLKYHLKNCCGVCQAMPEAALYQQWIQQARQIIKGDAHDIAKDLQAQMTDYAAKMQYEEAQRIKEKLELLEKFNSKNVIANSSIKDLDVCGYDEQGDRVFVSMLHIHNGCVVQGQTIEYKRQMEETREQMLAYGMQELRERFGSTCKDVIIPFIPDVIDETLHLYIATSGEKKKLLDLAMRNVNQYKQDILKQADKLNPDQRAARILGELQTLLHLPSLPVFIDSFDNSNIQGTNAVGCCVTFKKARPSKSDYKRFNIQTVRGADDYASMREIVRRRYQDIIDENGTFPDLIIADGGLGQMLAIREVIEDQLGLHIPIAGLKKNEHHRTQTLLYGFPPQEFMLPVSSELFRLMVQIQDEVHRFAISFHKKKRSTAQTHSQLDDIQGVGPVRKQKILTHFGSLKRAGTASLDEWIQLLGKNCGSVIYEQIQSNLSL